MSFFNAADVKFDDMDSQDFSALPAGEYDMIVEEIAIKPNKAGTGETIHLTLLVVGETGKGRKIWDYIVYKHTNEIAENIGRQKLSLMCTAIGQETLEHPDSLQELKHKPFKGILTKEQDTYKGETKMVNKFKMKAVRKSSQSGSKAPAQSNEPDCDESQIPF